MSTPPLDEKPLAGSCHHQWVDQETGYVVAQVCALCRLFRYKASATADWEYRAPIPFANLLDQTYYSEH
jgi:hypothetical protein